jgi:hypothetical protein
MPVDEVVRAIGSVTYAADAMKADVLILAWPRRDLPESSAEGTAIFLTPGRIDYPTPHVHYTVAHELGHVVHNALMPDSREDLWAKYAGLRGIDLASAGRAGHASRMHEIFAEDFRALFGGAMAQCGSGVENHELVPPDEVAGLREFFLSLPDVWKNTVRVYAGPNPFKGNLTVGVFSLGADTRIDRVTVYDVEGKLVASLAPSGRSACEVTWDGRCSSGALAGPGAYFAVIDCASKAQPVKVLRLPR